MIGRKTLAAILQIQTDMMKDPDGRVDPFGYTIRKLWPVAFGHPTGLGIRGKDAYGSGQHGARRGHRTHDGTDYIVTPDQKVKAPLSGRVVRISKPYSSGIDADLLSGVQIWAADGTKCWVWYIKPSPNIVGQVVWAGMTVVGVAKTLKNRYKKGITDHVHVRIHSRDGSKINPASVIK